MKQINLQPLNQDVEVDTNTTLLKVLLDQQMKVLQACGAQGRCATCHVYIRSGMEKLSPPNAQERLTLSFISTVQPNSRLACQSRILGDGVVVELPSGMYVGSLGELKALIGQRATANLIHPYTGELLVEEGKLILRSALEKMSQIDETFAFRLSEILKTTQES